MVNVKNEGCEFFSTKICFKDSGEDRVVYVNNTTDHINMFDRSARFTDIKITSVVPTEEQSLRLELINLEDLEEAELWSSNVNDYVQHGYVNSVDSKVTGMFFDDCIDSSKKYLLETINKSLAEHRYNKEVSGSAYGDLVVKTDRESQATVTSSIVALQAGLLTNVNFKFKNGWKQLDAAEFITVATNISNHVNNCFKAEELVMATLGQLSIQELNDIVYPNNNMGVISEDESDKLNPIDMFESNYASFYN